MQDRQAERITFRIKVKIIQKNVKWLVQDHPSPEKKKYTKCESFLQR